jgi:hypothetical protein
VSLTYEQSTKLEILRAEMPVGFLSQVIDILLEGPIAECEEEEYEGRDYDKPEKQCPYPLTYNLTLDREIKLFKRLLRGRPVELTDASPETATMREILETEAVVLIEKLNPSKIKEYDLDGSVFWSKDRKSAIIRFDRD